MENIFMFLVAICASVCVATGVPSAGCKIIQKGEFEIGARRFHYLSLDYHDTSIGRNGKTFSEAGWPELEHQKRHYGVAFPADYYDDVLKPLVIELPGMSTPAYSDFVEGGWRRIVGMNETVLVIPEGMKDATYLDRSEHAQQWVSNDPKTYVWSVGGQKSEMRERPNELKADCGPDSGFYGVYASCHAKGEFPTDESKQCSWSTCVDDFGFLKKLFSHLYDTVCFDTSRVILSGQSTGGMLVYQLMHEHSEKFLAIVPQNGLNFNSEKFNPESWPKSTNWVPNLVHIHGLRDDTVPYKDLMSWGWYHTTAWESQAKFASLLECDRTEETEDELMRELNSPTLVEGNPRIYPRERVLEEFLEMGIPRTSIDLGIFSNFTIQKESSKSIPYHGKQKGDKIHYTCRKHTGCIDGKLIADCTHDYKHVFFRGNAKLAWNLISTLPSMPEAFARDAWTSTFDGSDDITYCGSKERCDSGLTCGVSASASVCVSLEANNNEHCGKHSEVAHVVFIVILLTALTISLAMHLKAYFIKLRIPETYIPLNGGNPI